MAKKDLKDAVEDTFDELDTVVDENLKDAGGPAASIMSEGGGEEPKEPIKVNKQINVESLGGDVTEVIRIDENSDGFLEVTNEVSSSDWNTVESVATTLDNEIEVKLKCLENTKPESREDYVIINALGTDQTPYVITLTITQAAKVEEPKPVEKDKKDLVSIFEFGYESSSDSKTEKTGNSEDVISDTIKVEGTPKGLVKSFKIEAEKGGDYLVSVETSENESKDLVTENLTYSFEDDSTIYSGILRVTIAGKVEEPVEPTDPEGEEAILDEIKKIAASKQNYNYLNCGRHFNDGITIESLQLFYSEFVYYGIKTKEDGELLEYCEQLGLKNPLVPEETEEDSETEIGD